MEMESITSKLESYMPNSGNTGITLVILPFIISLIAAVVGVFFLMRS